MASWGDDKEQRDMERAIEESRRDYDIHLPSVPSGQPVSWSRVPNTASGRDPAIDLVILQLGVHVEHMSSKDADTIVLIGEPPQSKGQDSTAYAKIKAHYGEHHLVHSEKLFALGSQKFNDLLSVDKQTRLQRTLRHVLPYGKPLGVKYVLDLRPPSEDDEAVLFLTELSCTDGVLNWHLSRDHFGMAWTMVEGQDELAMLPEIERKRTVSVEASQDEEYTPSINQTAVDSPYHFEELDVAQPPKRGQRIGNWEGRLPMPPSAQPEVTQYGEPVSGCERGPWTPSETEKPVPTIEKLSPTFRHSLEQYSPLRHRSAIERVLSAIEYQDPRLDSAPKIWSYFAIAKHFDIATHERINGWIMKWIFAEPNHNFIQVNPEVCYKIGMGIKSPDLTKDAFSILVGEKALMSVFNNGRVTGRKSVHGRKLELLDDDEQNRVDHAASGFIVRIQEIFRKLIDTDHSLLVSIPEVLPVLYFQPRSEHERKVQETLIKHLRGYIRRRILGVLATATHYHHPMQPLTNHLDCETEDINSFFSGYSSFRDTYKSLPGDARIFTRTFWTLLHHEDIADDWSSSSFSPDLAMKTWLSLSEAIQGDKDLPVVNREQLDESVRQWNRVLLLRAEMEMQVMFAQPQQEEEDALGKMMDLSVSSPKRSKEPAATLKRRKLSNPNPTQGVAGHQNVVAGPSSTATSTAIHQDVPFRGIGHSEYQQFVDTSGMTKNLLNKTSQVLKGYAQHAPPQTTYVNSQGDVKKVEEDNARNPNIEGLEASPEVRPQATIVSNIDYSDDASSTSSDDSEPIPQSARARQPQPTNNTLSNPNWVPPIQLFRLERGFFASLKTVITKYTSPLIDPPHIYHSRDRLPIRLIDTLLCLSADISFSSQPNMRSDNKDDPGEFRYLPLWAGGNDDGTGGVFDEIDVPNLEAGGFSTAGPSIHTGSTPATSVFDGDGSEFSDVDLMSDAMSTVGKASANATDGTITAGSVRSINTGDEYEDDMYEDVRTEVGTATYNIPGETHDEEPYSHSYDENGTTLEVEDVVSDDDEMSDNDDDDNKTEVGAVSKYDDDSDPDSDGFEHVEIEVSDD